MSTVSVESSAHAAAGVRIEAPRGLIPLRLGELWRYRELLLFLLAREIKGRYRQMALGPLWLVLGPLLSTGLFTFLFSYIGKFPSDGIPYPLFSYSALVTWGFFSSVMQTSARSLLDSRDLIAKVYFPRLVMPLVGVLSALVNILPSFLILGVMMAVWGYAPGWQILALPVYLLLAGAIGLAVGLWWASWIVHYRDLSNLLDYGAKAWMYLTPVVYATSKIPEAWRGLYRLNPMTQVVEGVRWALFRTERPSWPLLAYSALIVALALVGGAYHFRRAERSIVDIA